MVDDTSKLFDWCFALIRDNRDWESMSLDYRKKLLNKFKIVISALTEIQVSESDILSLIKPTDVMTVFESLLSVWSYDKGFKDKYTLMAYLRKVVLSTWKEKNGFTDLSLQPGKVSKRGRPRSQIASKSVVKKYNPLNMCVCSKCGKTLKKESNKDICSNCNEDGTHRLKS
jgi:hypothetical protein